MNKKDDDVFCPLFAVVVERNHMSGLDLPNGRESSAELIDNSIPEETAVSISDTPYQPIQSPLREELPPIHERRVAAGTWTRRSRNYRRSWKGASGRTSAREMLRLRTRRSSLFLLPESLTQRPLEATIRWTVASQQSRQQQRVRTKRSIKRHLTRKREPAADLSGAFSAFSL